jgi:hypothetical protein
MSLIVILAYVLDALRARRARRLDDENLSERQRICFNVQLKVCPHGKGACFTYFLITLEPSKHVCGGKLYSWHNTEQREP